MGETPDREGQSHDAARTLDFTTPAAEYDSGEEPRCGDSKQRSGSPEREGVSSEKPRRAGAAAEDGPGTEEPGTTTTDELSDLHATVVAGEPLCLPER